MKDKPENRTAVIKLKLGACLTAPTKRGVADLHEAARLFNIAQNVMIRHWEKWCENNQNAFDMPGHPGCKMQLPNGFSNVLYHQARAVVPQLASNIINGAPKNILGKKQLLKKFPRIKGGCAVRVWQAVLWNEAARPCFRGSGFYVTNKSVLSYGDDHATVTIPVWSKQAGRKNTSHTFRIETRQLPRGLKNIVRKVSTGEGDWKFCDSEMVYHPSKKRRGKGDWFLHLCYQRPPINERHNPDRVATVTLLGKDEPAPFEVSTEGTFPWKIPRIPTAMVEAFRRLESRRLAMRNKYRDAGSGVKGHGRARIEGAIRPVSRAVKAIMERFVKLVVSRAIEYCRRYDCGTLVFVPPRTREKSAGWLAQHGVDWDWTRFQSLLSHRCWLFGIAMVNEPPASGVVVQGGPGDARKAQPVGGGRIRKGGPVKSAARKRK